MANTLSPNEGTESEAELPRAMLNRLFTHLKITKIVFVDDEAEPQINAGTIIKVLAEKEAAKEPLARFFPGVKLAPLENDALQEQVNTRLGELDAEGRAGLREVLVAQSGDAAEYEAFGRLKGLMPEGADAQLLTPRTWHEQRGALIGECTEEHRTLFLFDQDLEVNDETLGFAKGSDIIRDMVEKEKASFGTRWFCGMLTHTVEKGDEITSWRRLAESEDLDLCSFMPIAKATMYDDDALAFYSAIYRTLINIYCQTIKSLAQDAFREALENALERFVDLDPIDFEHLVVQSSEIEGVSELETLIRLYGIIQKDQVKSQILQQPRAGEFAAAARSAKDIADIGRKMTTSSQERLHKLRREELYESDQLVNSYNDPIRNGDIFEIGKSGGRLKLWVLIAQPCDLMVRSDGKRAREENFKVAVLAPLCTRPLGDKVEVKNGLDFSLEHYDHDGAQSAVVRFADATPANLHILDLAVFNEGGHCQLAAVPDPAMSLPSRAWEKRDAILSNHFRKVTKQIERARSLHGNPVADLLATAIIPRGAPGKAFAKYGTYNGGAFSYPIRRCGRIRDPLATSLLMAYSRFLARDADKHDFSKAE